MNARFANVSDRDKRLLAAGGFVLMLILGYFLLYEPLSNDNRRLRAALERQDIDLAWMRQASRSLRDRPVVQAAAAADEPLLVIADRTIQAAGLKQQLKRIQPDGDDKIRLWLEHASFGAVIKWLDTMQRQHGIRVDAATVDRQEATGVVNAKLVLVTGEVIGS